MKNLITLLICVLTSGFSLGQDYYFKHYRVESGLSHNSVITTLQDHNGFMWFGTKDGLNRFDGYNFKVFNNNPNDPKSLGSNMIWSLVEFNDHLWVGTHNGLFKYNESQENFDLIPGTIGNPVLNLMDDQQGNIWFVLGGILFKYSDKGTGPIGYNTFNATSVVRMEDGTIVGSSFGQLHLYNKATNTFTTTDLDFKGVEGQPFVINKLFALAHNTLLIGTQNHGVLIYNLKMGTISKLLPDSENPLYIRDYALKGDHELWLATESGLYIYNLENKNYVHLTKKNNNPYALSDNALYSITVDLQGGVWMGTYFGGVEYYPVQLTPFKKYFTRFGENSINGNIVREIHPDQYGNLWIGTEDAGVNKLDTKTGLFTNYQATKESSSLSYNNVHGILPDGDKLWIGTFEHGLDVLNILTGKVIRHYGMSGDHGLRSNFVYSFYRTRADNLLVLTTGGLQYYNSTLDGFSNVEGFPEKIFFFSFLEDKDGNMWAGTYQDGLLFYDPHTKTKKYFKYQIQDQTGLSSNTINAIFQDSQERIWITTDNGLNLYNPARDNFTRFSTKDGFPSNVIYSILEDEEQTLWISTSKGLVRFDPRSKETKIFTRANGLLNDQFNYNSAYKDKNGRMYFGNLSGMNSFDPKEFTKSTYNPPIFITSLQINNKEVPVNQKGSPLDRSITLIDKIKLNPNQSSFSIDFAALSYTSPEMTEYWYKLKGLSNDWIELKRNHRVYFTELPAGSYNFMVKSSSSIGEQSEETSALMIEVLPPFWASKIAYFIYFSLVALLFYFSLRFYHRQTKAKNAQKIRQLNNRKEKEIYQAKIEFFTNVSHEIRTPLTLIKSPLEKILKREGLNPDIRENLSIMEKNTSRLLELVNQLLDFRRTEIENITLTFVKTNFSDLVRNIHSRFSQNINERDINIELSLGEDDIYAYLDKEAVVKIISNLFNNAIKYSEKQIKISLNTDNESLVFIMQNDGPIIPGYLKDKIFEPFYRVPGMENHTGTGIGLSMAFSFAEMHNGSLELEIKNTEINTFVLKLPLHQEKEFNLRTTIKSDGIEPDYHNKNLSLETENSKIPILMVEDNEDLLDFVSKDLNEIYTVLKTTEGKEALEIMDNNNVQLVVSDIMMAGMDGFSLCKIIKNSMESSHIPVILLTAKNAFDARIEGLEAGADAYIEKPFSMEHLRAQMANLLENRKNLREFYASSPLAHLKSIALTKTDESFLKKLDDVIITNISDPNLSVDTLADAMHVSRSSLYRKIKEISDLSPNELINIVRLKRAAELLNTKEYKIYEIAEMVGYNSQTSFGRNFQKQFNMTPTEYMNS